MDRFIIPQFIDSEDKVIGAITVRQFLICSVGGLLVFAAYKLSTFYVFILEAFLLLVVTISFAFLKINGKIFQNFILDVIEYVARVPKFAVWQRNENAPIIKEIEEKKKVDDYVFIPKALPKKKLSEISLIIDTGGAYGGEITVDASADTKNKQEVK